MRPELAEFLALKESLHVAPGERDSVCDRLTTSLDRAVQALSLDAGTDRFALLAVGGYGRRELCIHSDVDLVILHDGADLERVAGAVLYPLWDSNLKVGHATRTLAETRAACRAHVETLTGMLTARFLAGEAALFEALPKMLRQALRSVDLTGQLAEFERDRRLAEPYMTMAVDLKSGRGGLRTLDAFLWERHRDELLGRVPDEPHPEEEAGRAVLLEVRNALHAVTGRRTDRYALELRERVANWLDTDVVTLTNSITTATAATDRLASRRWRLDEPRSRRRGPKRVSRKPATDGAVAAATAGRPIPAVAAQDLWTSDERRAFVALVRSGARGRAVLDRLLEAGWVTRAFPAWEGVATRAQLEPFHDHPVGAHLWRTADELMAIVTRPTDLQHRVIESLGATDDLLLAGFLHDIGKGRGGDHAIVGADLAQDFMRRAGFGPVSADTVGAAVRHHLSLVRTALRRDIASGEVIDEVVRDVGDPALLDLLYLLTIADGRATGASYWTEWKEQLVTQLFLRASDHMQRQVSAPQATPEQIEAMGARFDAAHIENHVSLLPDDYPEVTESEDILRHLDAIESIGDGILLAPDPDGHRVHAFGRDRRGFLLTVCSTFAARGIGIRNARIFTRTDGIAIDTFDVADDRTGDPIDAARWAEVEISLARAHEGRLDIAEAVQTRASAYDRPTAPDVTVTPQPDFSNRHEVIEVRAPDRVGLLADVLEAVLAEGADLRLARIDTRAGEATDVLFLDPGSITDDVELLCERIRRALVRDQPGIDGESGTARS